MNTVEIAQYNACIEVTTAHRTVSSTESTESTDNYRVAGRPLPPAEIWVKKTYSYTGSGIPEGSLYGFEKFPHFKPIVCTENNHIKTALCNNRISARGRGPLLPNIKVSYMRRFSGNTLMPFLLLFLILTFLTGCGGRVSSPAPSPIPSPVPVEISANPPEDARILAKQGKFDEALKLLSDALAKNPDDVDIYLALALVNRQKGDMKAALEACNNGLLKKYQNLQLLEEKAALLFETGRKKEAAIINLRILRLFKTDPSISPDMASLAREQIAKALKEDPKSRGLRATFNDAMSMIEKDLKKKPGDELLQREKANMLRQAGRYEEAVGVYRKIKEDEKKNLFVPLDIGKTYLEAGEYGKAEAEFEKTIKQYPDNFRSYRNYGLYWLERGTKTKGNEAVGYLDKSVKYYEKALSLASLPIDTSYLQLKAAEGRYHRWKVTGAEEDRKAALEAMEEYYKIAPEWTTTDIADHFMKELKK